MAKKPDRIGEESQASFGIFRKVCIFAPELVCVPPDSQTKSWRRGVFSHYVR